MVNIQTTPQPSRRLICYRSRYAPPYRWSTHHVQYTDNTQPSRRLICYRSRYAPPYRWSTHHGQYTDYTQPSRRLICYRSRYVPPPKSRAPSMVLINLQTIPQPSSRSLWLSNLKIDTVIEDKSYICIITFMILLRTCF